MFKPKALFCRAAKRKSRKLFVKKKKDAHKIKQLLLAKSISVDCFCLCSANENKIQTCISESGYRLLLLKNYDHSYIEVERTSESCNVNFL